MKKLKLILSFFLKRIILLLLFSGFYQIGNAQSFLRMGMSAGFSPLIKYENSNEKDQGHGLGILIEAEILTDNFIQHIYFVDYVESSFNEDFDQAFEDVIGVRADRKVQHNDVVGFDCGRSGGKIACVFAKLR